MSANMSRTVEWFLFNNRERQHMQIVSSGGDNLHELPTDCFQIKCEIFLTFTCYNQYDKCIG